MQRVKAFDDPCIYGLATQINEFARKEAEKYVCMGPVTIMDIKFTTRGSFPDDLHYALVLYSRP